MFICKYSLTRQHLHCITLKLVVSIFILIIVCHCHAQDNNALNIQEHLYFMFLLPYSDSKGIEPSNFVDYRKHETTEQF